MNCEAITRPNGGGRGSNPPCGKPAFAEFAVGKSKIPLCAKHASRKFYREHPTGKLRKLSENR